jgi:hypothetical protein
MRIAFASALLASCGGEICDSAALTTALAAASSGDEVRIGECDVSGTFTVPSGVALSGVGPGASIVSGNLVVEPGQVTVVRALSIRTDGGFAVLARGGGGAVVEDVGIEVMRGVGLGFEDLNELTLDGLIVEGPVDPANVGSFPADAGPATHATHGIAVVRVDTVEMSDVSVSGFAQIGVVAADSNVAWTGGSLAENLGVGIAVEGGSAELDGISVVDTLEGFRLLPAYAGIFSGAAVTTDGLSIERSEGVGLLHYGGGTAAHTTLSATDNDDAALWGESIDELSVTGAIADNGFAGVVAIDVPQVTIQSASIDRTRASTRIFHPNLALRVGDGIHLVRSATVAELVDLTLEANERAGIFIDLDGGALDGMRFQNVTITVTSTAQVGLLAQGGVLDPMWDQGVTRTGSTRDADLAKAPLSRVEGTGPCDRPVETNLATSGLGPLGAP